MTGSSTTNVKSNDLISATADDNTVVEISSVPSIVVRSKFTPSTQEPAFQMPTAELAAWITKAIKDGQYSPEQIEILKAQKRNVVEVAQMAIEQHEREAVPRNSPYPRNSTRPNDANVEDDTAIEDSGPPALPKLRLFPYCKFQACQACRPTFRDRTWQHFADVYALDASAIIESEDCDFFNTRPLTSCNVSPTIGCRTPEPRVPLKPPLIRRQHRSFRDCNKPNKHLRVPDSPAKKFDDEKPDDIGVAYSQLETGTNSFHENVRRVMKGLNRWDSPSSSRKVRMVPNFIKNDEAALNRKMDGSSLEEVAYVPLPEQDITDGVVEEVGELEKVDFAEGVAVKEESADLGAADVIISV